MCSSGCFLVLERVVVKINTDYSKCTSFKLGKIKSVKCKGEGFPTVITVEYIVNRVTYILTENLNYTKKTVKLGFIPVWRKVVPIMSDTRVKAPTSIAYNPDNPAQAYIVDNAV